MPAVVDPRFPARLRELRERAGLSYRRLADRVHYSRSYLHQLETGARPPTVEVAARLDQVLDAGGELARMAYELPALIAPDDSARLDYAAAHPRRLDAAAVTALEDLLAAQRRMEDAVGSAPMLAPVRAQLDMVGRLVACAPDDELRTRLLDVAGQWAHLAGWLNATTGAHEIGRAWYMRAMEWGTEAGNPHLVATVLSMRGHLAWVRGQTRAMVELSRAAGWQPASLGVRSLAMQQEARGLSLLGDGPRTDELLDRAEEMAIQAADRREFEPPWMYFYDSAFFSLQRGLAQLYLGRHERAVELLEAGLAALPPDIRGSDWIAWYVLQLAAARAGAGDQGGAVDALEEARSVADATSAARLAGDVETLARDIT